MQETVRSFADLTAIARAFMSQKSERRLLIIVGDPGVSKSSTFSRLKDDEKHRIIKAGNLSAFQFYLQLYQSRNKVIILDDVEEVVKRGDKTLMNLCESGAPIRTVAWYGSTSQLKVTRGKKVTRVPQEFKTSSRVVLICNSWDILTSKTPALLDRGKVVFFDPPPGAIHEFVGRW